MAHIFTPEEKTLIADQLESLGFSKVEHILGSMAYLANNIPGKLVLADFSSAANVEYFFEFSKGPKNNWVLDNLEAILQYDGPGGDDAVSKKYDLKNGPLPSKTTAEVEIVERMRKAKIYDAVRADPNIQEQLNRMGFTNFHEIFEKPTDFSSITVLQTKHLVDASQGNPREMVKFEFVVVTPPEPRTPFIFKINVFLLKDKANKEKANLNTLRTYCPISGNYPMKDHMISQVIEGKGLKSGIYDRIRIIFKGAVRGAIDLSNPGNKLKPRNRR